MGADNQHRPRLHRALSGGYLKQLLGREGYTTTTTCLGVGIIWGQHVLKNCGGNSNRNSMQPCLTPMRRFLGGPRQRLRMRACVCVVVVVVGGGEGGEYYGDVLTCNGEGGTDELHSVVNF